MIRDIELFACSLEDFLKTWVVTGIYFWEHVVYRVKVQKEVEQALPPVEVCRPICRGVHLLDSPVFRLISLFDAGAHPLIVVVHECELEVVDAQNRTLSVHEPETMPAPSLQHERELERKY